MRRLRMRRFRSGRRRSPETYTVVSCHNQVLVGDSTCTNPVVNAIPVMLPTLATGPDTSTAGSVVGQKANIVKGIKFNAEHFLDNQFDTENFTLATFGVGIWDALVVLPLAAGSKTAPLYLPKLTDTTQAFDLADRVLWKRFMRLHHYSIFNFGATLVSTFSDSAGGPQTVKSGCRIDDRHGLFYVWSYVHDVVAEGGLMTFELDAWFKLFYRSAFTK